MDQTKEKIRVAIAGVGNCAASLVQGVGREAAEANRQSLHLITDDIDGYRHEDIEFVAAFDIDDRKVGKPLSDAIFALPNCSLRFGSPPKHTHNVIVEMAPIKDGIADHIKVFPDGASVRGADIHPCNVTEKLRDSSAEVLVIFLPVGATEAVCHFAQAAFEARVALVNCVPVFIANDPYFAGKFSTADLPLVGDDVRSQVGATIVHQRLVELFVERGCEIKDTYQINIGGNMDFLNMLDRNRLKDKKQSKTDAVLRHSREFLNEHNTHIGPSDVNTHPLAKVCDF